ncbi:MAG: DUF1178 family protein [Pseudomonadota bacterium]|nr:DUF1178 family protein [Pseudomonadota bacterium]
MIKYNLKCGNKHEFESWFSDSKEFEKLSKKKFLECIFCNSKNIQKSIMSPRVLSSKKNSANKSKSHELKKIKKDLINLRKFVEKNFEFVGDKFAKKVRDVYYDKKSNKNIYGSTTEKEREELKEEGIDLVSIPWVERDN